MGSSETQRITLVDIAKGRIRIPIGQKDTFPAERELITVRLKGVEFRDVAWDPRFGPDRERSGVLSIGKRLHGLVATDERLGVAMSGSVVEIG